MAEKQIKPLYEKEYERDYKKYIQREKAKEIIKIEKEDRKTEKGTKKEHAKDAINSINIPKHIKLIKLFFIVIPLIIILYLLSLNFIISKEFNYFYDIGSMEDIKNPYLTPANRISEVFNNNSADNNANYRNLTNGLVYFDIPIPRNSEKISIQVKFKDNFPENSNFLLGAKDKEEWHYTYKQLYNPIFENFSKFKKFGNIYQINPNLNVLKLNGIKNYENLLKNMKEVVIASDKFVPVQNKILDYEKKTTIINTSLRGMHVFYIYASGDLFLKVKKQDINWYNNSDELKISLYNINRNLITNATIPDDGISEAKKGNTIIQTGTLEAENLTEGIYRLEFSDFDGLIREIEINTNKIVAANRVYLADSSVFFDDIEKPSLLYTKTIRDSEISFITWHEAALQTVYINEVPLDITARASESVFNASVGEYEIKSLKNDLIISTTGYFSFSKEDYFEPFKQRIVPIKNNIAWLEKNADYLAIDYKTPVKDGDWLVAETEFNIKTDRLFIKDNKLSMVFNIPHLGNNLYTNNTIPIDYIKITVYKIGMFKDEE